MEQSLRKYNEATDFDIVFETMKKVAQVSGLGHGTGKLYSVRKALEDKGIEPPDTETLDCLIDLAATYIKLMAWHTMVETKTHEAEGVDDTIFHERFTKNMRD